MTVGVPLVMFYNKFGAMVLGSSAKLFAELVHNAQDEDDGFFDDAQVTSLILAVKGAAAAMEGLKKVHFSKFREWWTQQKLEPALVDIENHWSVTQPFFDYVVNSHTYPQRVASTHSAHLQTTTRP